MEKENLVLVVDDSEINLKIAEKIIGRNYTVKCVPGAEECFEFLKEEIPDLILLDIHMPEIDGFAVMQALGENDLWKDIPIILLTADNDQDAEIRGYELGAMDFVTKPFIAEVMLKRVERVLELVSLRREVESLKNFIKNKNYY